ncbi:helix-turn-helix transcriptional regulator [Paracoccus ravus]|uniref:helix-turn-helix transcriptional regulator n=1 Tax=Paracoccus ravus TaxID=2447760 RepID=UPI00106EC202|nr:helix-turn-helix transcriptional regulator [Paracoccus ravus]
MVLVRRLSPRLSAPRSSFAALYGLAPAETAVLDMIARGNGVVGSARILGSSVATVKAHLQRIFNKTGVRRQADLVALISSSGLSAEIYRPHYHYPNFVTGDQPTTDRTRHMCRYRERTVS